jgi:hypothetical protein
MPRRKPKNCGGRPSKWKPEVIIPPAICLRAGMPLAAAARRAATIRPIGADGPAKSRDDGSLEKPTEGEEAWHADGQ